MMIIEPGLHSTWRGIPGGGAWRWPHFSAREMACRCGRHCAGEYFHNPVFLDRLEHLRAVMGGPLHINSGRRCAIHNATVGGAALSQHKIAVAVDIGLRGHDAQNLAMAAADLGFTGLGFGQTFLHVDQRPVRAGFHYSLGAKRAWRTRFGFDPAVEFKLKGNLRRAA